MSLSNDYFTQQIVARAVTGAVVGGLIGGLTGDGKGAAIGVVTGLAAGAASAYFDQLRQENADRHVLAMQVNSDLSAEVKQMDHTAATFAALRSCRFAQAHQIKDDAKAGRLTRADALAQLDHQHKLFAEEVAVAQQAGLNMRSRDEQFAYAAQSIQASGTNGQPTHPAAPATKPNRPAAQKPSPGSVDPVANANVLASETIPQKRNSFEASVGTAATQSKTAFELDSAAVSHLREVLSENSFI